MKVNFFKIKFENVNYGKLNSTQTGPRKNNFYSQ